MDDLTFIIELSNWDATNGTVEVRARSGSKTLTLNPRVVQIDHKNRPSREHPDDVRAYGMDLYKKLLSEDVMNHYQQMVGEAAKSGSSVHVQLEIRGDALELHAVPWELLCDDQGGLARSAKSPFSRFLVSGDSDQPAVSERPLRLLLAIANPETLVEQLTEIQGIPQTVDALADLVKDQKGKITATILPGRKSLSPKLQRRLEEEGWTIASGVTSWNNILKYLPGQHIVHIVAHGLLHDNNALLLLEPDPGDHEAETSGVDFVSDQKIAAGLVGASPCPQLVFLAACESAKPKGTGVNAFIGLGPTIVKAGVPAVVAMQDEVPMELTPTLTTCFYQDLFQHGQVDRALNVARSWLFEEDSFDWSIPVIFMRLADGQLFVEPEGHLPMSQPARAGHAGSVLMDEGHYQAEWYYGTPTMRKGFKRIADIVKDRAGVSSLFERLGKDDLQECRALILPIGPGDKEGKENRLTEDEIEAIKDFVRRGGGLLVLGAYTGDAHHGGNLNTLLRDYGMQFNPDVVMPAGFAADDAFVSTKGERKPDSKFAVKAFPTPDELDAESLDVQQTCLEGITSVMTLSSCSLEVDGSLATVLLQSPSDSDIFKAGFRGWTTAIQSWERRTGTATLLAASKTDRVVVSGCSTMFVNEFLDYDGCDNLRLFRNILGWLMSGSA